VGDVAGEVEVVRQPVRVSERMGRTLDQRIRLRSPWLAGAVARLLSKLPPRSRFRRAALGRAVKLGIRLQEFYDHGEALEAAGLSD
jgi:hypothetical protein